jgi:hypothetical protein
MLVIPTLEPMEFQRQLWPNCKMYREQREVIYSVRDNFETVVVAGNQLGDGPTPT